MDRAREYDLDLVEVSPNSRPTVCRILDYGKFKYEIAKKDKLAKKKQHSNQLKEMRFRPKIDDHDFQFKTKHVREFIETGAKVKVFVMFRGREMAYTEFGRRVLERVKEDLSDVCTVEVQPKMEGRHMNMILVPSAEILMQLKKAGSSKEKENEKNSSRPQPESVETE